MVESVGVIFPDCPEGNKHAPAFGDVIVSNPLTLPACRCRGTRHRSGLQCFAHQLPGHLLLTEDMAKVMAYDGCPCGRRGISFRFAGRIPKAEIRGCGNLQSKRALVN